MFKGENWVHGVAENSRKRHWMMREECQIPLALITQFSAFCPLRLSAAERLIYRSLAVLANELLPRDDGMETTMVMVKL